MSACRNPRKAGALHAPAFDTPPRYNPRMNAPAAPPQTTRPAAKSTRDVVPTLEELYEEFEFLGNWEDRCEYLIDLGLDLPSLPDPQKNECTRVHGCQSLVWLVTDWEGGGGPARLRLAADSDAMIVKGLIAVLSAMYDGRTAEEVLDVDVPAIFAKLGLDEHLSTARKNGFSGMVARVRESAVDRLTPADANTCPA